MRILETFISDECERLNKAGITTTLVKSSMVSYGETKCNGYFADIPLPLLSVAIDKKFEDWAPVFIHESCHADQFLVQAPCWKRKIGTMEPMAVLDLWLDHHVELNAKQLMNTIQGALQIELDCEKRAVEKYKINKLGIDIEEYIQKANSYVYFYNMIAENRTWYSAGKAPYSIPAIWKEMPIKFMEHYMFVPHQYIELYQLCYDKPT